MKINVKELQINTKGKQYKHSFKTGRHKSKKDYDRKRDKDKLRKEVARSDQY